MKDEKEPEFCLSCYCHNNTPFVARLGPDDRVTITLTAEAIAIIGMALLGHSDELEIRKKELPPELSPEESENEVDDLNVEQSLTQYMEYSFRGLNSLSIKRYESGIEVTPSGIYILADDVVEPSNRFVYDEKSKTPSN